MWASAFSPQYHGKLLICFMDKKSFFKGLLSGVGASVLAFLVAVGVYSCSNPPKGNENQNSSSLVEDNRVPNRGKVRRLLSAGEYVSNKVYNGSYSGSITSADFGISGSISLGGVTCSYNLVNLNYDSSNLVRIIIKINQIIRTSNTT